MNNFSPCRITGQFVRFSVSLSGFESRWGHQDTLSMKCYHGVKSGFDSQFSASSTLRGLGSNIVVMRTDNGCQTSIPISEQADVSVTLFAEFLTINQENSMEKSIPLIRIIHLNDPIV